MFNSVQAMFLSTQAGSRVMQYAWCLANRISKPLELISPTNIGTAHAMAVASGQGVIETRTEELQRQVSLATHINAIGELVRPILKNYDSTTELKIGTDVLWVSQDGKLLQKTISVLYPFAVVNPIASEQFGKLLIPYGNRESGQQTLTKGLLFAKQARMDVVFYHTTYRMRGCESKNPADHMVTEARQLLHEATTYASELNVKFESVIETAEDVTSGICRAAIAHGASMIAAIRDPKVVRGDYSLKLIERKLVPVLLFGTEEKNYA